MKHVQGFLLVILLIVVAFVTTCKSTKQTLGFEDKPPEIIDIGFKDQQPEFFEPGMEIILFVLIKDDIKGHLTGVRAEDSTGVKLEKISQTPVDETGHVTATYKYQPKSAGWQKITFYADDDNQSPVSKDLRFFLKGDQPPQIDIFSRFIQGSDSTGFTFRFFAQVEDDRGVKEINWDFAGESKSQTKPDSLDWTFPGDNLGPYEVTLEVVDIGGHKVSTTKQVVNPFVKINVILDKQRAKNGQVLNITAVINSSVLPKNIYWLLRQPPRTDSLLSITPGSVTNFKLPLNLPVGTTAQPLNDKYKVGVKAEKDDGIFTDAVFVGFLLENSKITFGKIELIPGRRQLEVRKVETFDQDPDHQGRELLKFQLNGREIASQDPPFVIADLAEGQAVLNIRAVDPMGAVTDTSLALDIPGNLSAPFEILPSDTVRNGMTVIYKSLAESNLPGDPLATYAWVVTKPDNSQVSYSGEVVTLRDLHEPVGRYIVKHSVQTVNEAKAQSEQVQVIANTLPLVKNEITSGSGWIAGEDLSEDADPNDWDPTRGIDNLNSFWTLYKPSGDSLMATGKKVRFDKLVAGTYTVKETVTDQSSQGRSLTKSVTIDGLPSARLEAPAEANNKQPFTLKVVDINPGGEGLSIVQYHWSVEQTGLIKPLPSTFSPELKINNKIHIFKLGKAVFRLQVENNNGDFSIISKDSTEIVNSFSDVDIETIVGFDAEGMGQLRFENNTKDVDGQALTHSWTVTDTLASYTSSRADALFNGLVGGRVRVDYLVSDGIDQVDTTFYLLNVESRPVIRFAVSPLMIDEQKEGELQITTLLPGGLNRQITGVDWSWFNDQGESGGLEPILVNVENKIFNFSTYLPIGEVTIQAITTNDLQNPSFPGQQNIQINNLLPVGDIGYKTDFGVIERVFNSYKDPNYGDRASFNTTLTGMGLKLVSTDSLVRFDNLVKGSYDVRLIITDENNAEVVRDSSFTIDGFPLSLFIFPNGLAASFTTKNGKTVLDATSSQSGAIGEIDQYEWSYRPVSDTADVTLFSPVELSPGVFEWEHSLPIPAGDSQVTYEVGLRVRNLAAEGDGWSAWFWGDMTVSNSNPVVPGFSYTTTRPAPGIWLTDARADSVSDADPGELEYIWLDGCLEVARGVDATFQTNHSPDNITLVVRDKNLGQGKYPVDNCPAW